MFRFALFPVVLVICIAFSSCGKKSGDAGEDSVEFGSRWEHEEHWMVDLVARNLAAMAKAAGAEVGEIDAKPAGEHVFTVGARKLTMSPSCWDMVSYMPLVADWKPARGEASADDGALVKNLLTPTAAHLQKANKEITKELAERPSDPAAHERAAFLLGVFGIRENARSFSDIRPLLCRMTAHLAFASYLRDGGNPGPEGSWALVLHDLHAGRPQDALRRAGNQPAEGASGRWKRAVELLVKRDWRRGGDLPDPSLVEAIALARALHKHQGNPAMIEFLENQEELQGIPEWSRILAGPRGSVGDGHIAMRSMMAMEFSEMNAVFATGEEPSPADIAKHFPDAPGDFTGGDVISNADWAAYFRRHFFAGAADVARFAIRQWSEMNAAAEWEQTVLPYCKAMKEHELVAPLVATDREDYQNRLADARNAIVTRPERTTVALWYDFRFPVLDCGAEATMPDQAPWFRTVSPPGTAHDPGNRIRFTGIHGSDWVDHLGKLRAIDPWNADLCFELAEKTGTDAAAVKQVWGDLLEYSVLPMRQLLKISSLTAEERIDVLRIHSGFDAEVGLDLGAELVIAGRDDEAIAAFENAFENAPDRVGVANRSQWMIHHYKKTGDDAAARKVADHNAEVYSHRGLRSAMVLAIVEGKHTRAASLARKIHERYDDPIYPLIAKRASGKNPQAAARLFPEGEQTVSVADLETAGDLAGLRIQDGSPIVRLNGLRPGEIILAVDGKRVKTFPQYEAVMDEKLDPEVTLIVRRGKKLREARCILPNRRLETQLVPVE